MAYYFRLDRATGLLAAFSPKCGSSSLRDWLKQLSLRDGVQRGDPPDGPFFLNRLYLHGLEDCYKVLFLRDPLRRLASFYAHWVVRTPGPWCFADEDRRFWLHQKSFRRFVYVLDHLHRHRLPFQHHLEPQLAFTDNIDFDRIVLVENLYEGLADLNRRVGFDYLPRQRTRTPYNPGLTECCADRSPEWFRLNGVPSPEWFFDRELTDLAKRHYAEDLAFYQRCGGQVIQPGG